MSVAYSFLRYTHNLVRSTNHVGERRNFCFTEMRRPEFACHPIFVLFALCSAQHGTSTPLCNNSKFQAPRNGLSRASSPTILKLRQILSNGRPQVGFAHSPFLIPHSSLKLRYSSNFSTDINASCGTDTDPSCLIRFLPSFCFSNSFFFLVISPP